MTIITEKLNTGNTNTTSGKAEPLLQEELPDYFVNHNLDNIVTPVNMEILVKLLKEADYAEQEITFLEDGFKNGFDIGYAGPTERHSETNNIPLRVGTKVQLWNKLMKEVKNKRVAGPFKTVPFDNYIQSPIGLVPKKGSDDQLHLIFHLSYNFDNDKNGEDGHQLLNAHTPKDRCSVKYRDLNFDVKAYLKLQGEGQNHRQKTVFGGKTDIKSAFRLVPLKKSCWRWLVMKARDPNTEEWSYFVNKCLPFGASISCAIFQ